MARVSEAEKRKTREKILDAAARLTRERGAEATSVADIMAAAGLTHGGFYRHFAGKKELEAAAFHHAVDGVVGGWETAPTDAAKAQARAAYLETYLSEQHRVTLGDGCPLAALGAEAAREQGPLREAASQTVERMTALLGAPETSDRSGKGAATLALLIGAVTLARLARSADEAEAVLEAAREALGLLERRWAEKRDETAGP